jgi:chromosomal replication initiation ATPase DnaA
MEKKIIGYFLSRKYSEFTGQEVADVMLKYYEPKRKSLKVDFLGSGEIEQLNTLLDAVESVVGMHFDDFNVKSRKDEFVIARFLTIHFIYTRMSLSLKNIGRIFGDRDHTTIMHARDMADTWISHSEIYKRENRLINDIARHLEPSPSGQE